MYGSQMETGMLAWITVAASATAAALWLAASLVPLPKEFNVGYGGVGGTAEILHRRLRLMGRLNAVGAGAASVAAAAQAWATWSISP
ncbi:hypothetical protein STHU_21400 [Allostella humosa]|nr:hypothetical protein STHU_21400 [Stella humosa]